MSDSALTRTSTETRSQNPSSVLPGALTGWRPDQGWILDHLLEGFQLIDHDWRYLYVNAAVARHARKSPTELIGRTMMDCFPGIDQTPMFALLQKCMRERIASTMDNTFHYEDGTEATFQLSIQPVAEGILVMSIDISEEKRTEGVLRWQKQMLEHVINGTSLEELLQELIDFIESQIPGGLCSVLLADDDGKSLHHLAGPRLPESYNSKLGLVPIGESIGSCGTAAYRKRPVVVADISADPLWKEYRQLALENHLASCWSVPIIEAGTGTADSRVLGTFAVYHRQPTKPTDDQLELVSIGARMAGIAIERRLTNEKVRESEERYRKLIDVLPCGVLITTDDRITFSNPAMTSLAGADSAQELLGLSFYDLIHPDYHATKRVRIERLQRTGSISAGSQIRLLRRDGSTLPVMTVATKITSRGRSSAIFAVTDLSDAERAHSLLTAVMRSVTDAIVTIDDRGVVQSINPAAEMLFGMSTDELIGHQIDLILPTPISSRSGEFSSFIAQHASKNHETRWEIELRRKDNMVIPVELSVTEFQLDGRRHYTGVARDISERRRLEEQLRQSQKMEAIGQLAGGIAHDFNNLIMVINGYGQLLSSELPADHPWFTSLQEILKSARSGSDLVRQLLAFSRKQRLQPRPIDLHQLILKSENMLRRLIGDGVLLQIGLRANRSFVMADPGQIEQVLLNLAVNARDAMNGQGQLRIETRNMSLIEEGGPPVEEGRPAIELSISDNGCGMDAATIERIFEPFFTTKPMGVGTGLGLSTVYGIVQQSGGSISVHSQPGEGAQFLVRLPITDQFNAAEKKAPAHPITSDTASRHETVLLVEDFAQLRALSAKLLRQRGYNVLEACDGADAERRYSARISEIDLLVTDIVMPHVSGLELIRRVRKLKPSLRVLMMSGYADSDPSSAADGLELYTYVRKPCAPDEFLDAVDQALRSNATS